MKKIFLLATGLAILSLNNVSSQILKVSIQKTSGYERIKTLKFKPGADIKICSLYIDTDSLKAANYYNGTFFKATKDSVSIKLNEFTNEMRYTDGRLSTTLLPVKNYSAINNFGKEEVKIAFTEIQLIKTDQKSKVWGALGLPLILSSFGAFLISPAICYKYGEGTFNTNLYKNIGLGCTLAALTGITIGIMTPKETYSLKDGWPDKRGKTWRIKLITP